jgi:hypothetical protein
MHHGHRLYAVYLLTYAPFIMDCNCLFFIHNHIVYELGDRPQRVQMHFVSLEAENEQPPHYGSILDNLEIIQCHLCQ